MHRPRSHVAVHVAALLVVASALVLPIAHAGIGEPFELEVAELSRRVAVHALGASELRQARDAAAPPTLGDLGMGELPFVAIGLAFRTFGLGTEVGRLPMALFALAGAASVGGLLARFASWRAGLLAFAVLATCPVYALHARTMAGDAVTLGGFAMSMAGLTGAFLERRPRLASGWLILAAAGLVTGFASRGLLLGVAAPLLGAGLGGLALSASSPSEPRARRAGVVAILAGLLAAAWFAHRAIPLASAPEGVVLRVVGVALGGAPEGVGSFDRFLRHLGHGLFPWSVVVPIAFARVLFGGASLGGSSPQSEVARRRVALGGFLATSALVSLAACTALAPHARDLPWTGAAAVAALVGLAFDGEDATPVSPAASLVAVFGAAILAADLAREPDRAWAVLGSEEATFPLALLPAAPTWFLAAAAAFVVPFSLALWPADLDERSLSWTARARDLVLGARRAVGAVGAAWDGWLAFSLVVVEAALVGLAAMVVLGEWRSWASITGLSQHTRRAFTHGFWLVPVLVIVAPATFGLTRRLFVELARRLGRPVESLAAALGVLAAASVTLGVYPAAASRASPKDVLAAYQSLRRPGEPLGLVGMRPQVALFHGGADVRSFSAAAAAFPWLAGDDGPEVAGARRWLVIKGKDLGKVNALHRARFGRNVPVADAASQSLLLVDDATGLTDRSPLADVVLDAPTPPARPLSARFEASLEVLGWEILSEEGAVVESITARERYRARFFVRALAPIAPSFRPFLHVDRGRLRWNGDDHFVDRGYPPALWQAGDVVVLECSLRLEANFGAGDYDVFFGFFAGGSRLAVTEGPASADRVRMGLLRVE